MTEAVAKAKVKKYIADNNLNTLGEEDINEAVYMLINNVSFAVVTHNLLTWQTENLGR